MGESPAGVEAAAWRALGLDAGLGTAAELLRAAAGRWPRQAAADRPAAPTPAAAPAPTPAATLPTNGAMELDG